MVVWSMLCFLLNKKEKKAQLGEPIQWEAKQSGFKLLELINDYSKVAGYKINTQKSLAFLYTNNEKIKREIKETIPFTLQRKE